jgi:hypothetical protein
VFADKGDSADTERGYPIGFCDGVQGEGSGSESSEFDVGSEFNRRSCALGLQEGSRTIVVTFKGAVKLSEVVFLVARKAWPKRVTLFVSGFIDLAFLSTTLQTIYTQYPSASADIRAVQNTSFESPLHVPEMMRITGTKFVPARTVIQYGQSLPLNEQYLIRHQRTRRRKINKS